MTMKHTIALAVLLGSMTVTSLAHAAGRKTYTNKAHGYSMRYPASWSVTLHAGHADVKFEAPDTDAIVSASATPGGVPAAAIKTRQAQLLKGMGTPQGSIFYKAADIHGITYQLSEIVTKTARGTVLDVVLLDAVHGAYLYDFEAFLLYKGPTYKPETTMVQQMLNSITLGK